MKRFKNSTVIENFVARFEDCQNHGESLRSVNGKLYNYGTVIGQYTHGNLIVNETKYSSTTSRLQNMLKREAYNYITVDNVPMNTSDLTKYVELGSVK